MVLTEGRVIPVIGRLVVTLTGVLVVTGAAVVSGALFIPGDGVVGDVAD